MLLLQDHVLPYIQDLRHVPDTLFIVLEESFRLFPGDGEPIAPDPAPTSAQSFLGTSWSDPDAAYPVPPGSDHSVLTLSQFQWQARVGVAPNIKKKVEMGEDVKAKASFITRPNKESRGSHEKGASPHLEALVRLCTAAHRQKLGGLVWFSWDDFSATEPKDSKPKLYGGSHGIACTCEGADWLEKEIPQMKLFHWDVVLRERLELGQAPACFIFPSIGHVVGPLGEPIASSGTGTSSAARRLPWHAQAGVGISDDDEETTAIWKWCRTNDLLESDNVVKVMDVALHKPQLWPDLMWKTFWTKAPPPEGEPIASQEQGPSGASSSQAPPPEPLTQEQMKEQVDLAKFLPTDKQDKGTRLARSMRTHKMFVKLRFFIQSESEAGLVPSCRFMITVISFSIHSLLDARMVMWSMPLS